MAVLLAVLGLAISADSSAQNLLLGPLARRVKAKIELDPRLPTGAVRHRQLAAGASPLQACSQQVPLCVAFDHSTERWVSHALSTLELAYRRLVYGAGLPPPLTNTRALTFEVVPVAQELSTELVTDLAVHFEQAGLVCRFGVTTNPVRPPSSHVAKGDEASPPSADRTRSRLQQAAWLCVGEAIAARLDAAESPQSRRAYARALAWQFASPSEYPAEDDRMALTYANARPYQSLAPRDGGDSSAPLSLFFHYLEQRLGTPAPMGLTTGLFTLSAEPRRAETPRFVNEPDWLDVLRDSLGDSLLEFAHRLNGFAAARAQLGSGEGALANLAWLTGLAPLVPDWALKVSTLPRRVASRRPIEPLGLIAVRVDIDVPAKDLSLAVRVEWETPVPFAWTVVKIDAQGHELGRMDLAFEPRIHFAEKHVTALEETRTLLILGTNLGGVDATHLLDPDYAPFEPHGCTVYVVRM